MVRNAHFGLFSGVYQNSVRKSTVEDIMCLTGTAAIVDLDVDLTGFTGTPPGLIPTTPALIRTRERVILMRDQGIWEIQSGQITVVTAAVAGL